MKKIKESASKESKESKAPKAPKESKAPKEQKASKAKKIAEKVEVAVELREIPEVEAMLTKQLSEKAMEGTQELLAEAFADLHDSRLLQSAYLFLNETGLTVKIVEKALDEAKALVEAGTASKIITCWIEHKGVMVSCKDVYRIANLAIGYKMTNKDFTTHDAIDELRFFVPICWGTPAKPTENIHHVRTIVE